MHTNQPLPFSCAQQGAAPPLAMDSFQQLLKTAHRSLSIQYHIICVPWRLRGIASRSVCDRCFLYALSAQHCAWSFLFQPAFVFVGLTLLCCNDGVAMTVSQLEVCMLACALLGDEHYCLGCSHVPCFSRKCLKRVESTVSSSIS
jgi:hypothetical protein